MSAKSSALTLVATGTAAVEAGGGKLVPVRENYRALERDLTEMSDVYHRLKDAMRGTGDLTEALAAARAMAPSIKPLAERLDRVCEPADAMSVAAAVGQFASAYEGSKSAASKSFLEQLMDDVADAEPTYYDLFLTFRTLRQTQKFMPRISEVLAELKSSGRDYWLDLSTPENLQALLDKAGGATGASRCPNASALTTTGESS
jgi:hypothetical protein